MSVPISYGFVYVKCMCANFDSPVVIIFLNMPVLVLTAAIFKFKIAVRYHVGSDC